MEKRIKVPANKCLTHVKKGQDYGSRNKNGQRNEQRRESKTTGAVPKTKNIQYPRQRNVVQRKTVGFDEIQSDDRLELYSVYEQGSKKQNLNHLLNFHYTPREQSTTSWTNNKRSKASAHIKYDKNQFLQANCRFVIKSGADFKAFVDVTDVLQHWILIEQIIMIMHENPQCPICLYRPNACRITKCGHYFCYSCVLHYLALSEKSWSKCPICTEAITVNDLKSVLIKPVTYHKLSDEVHFDLVKKECNGSVVVKSQSDISNEICLNLSGLIYSKIVVASLSHIMQIIDKEKTELTLELSNTEEETVFIEQALEFLNVKEQKTLMYFSENHEKAEEELNASQMSRNEYTYFYQLSDGQNMFLHPINCKMLETIYGDIKDCPPRVTGYVLHKEHKVIDESIWKRFKYLRHLPIASSIEICEIKFTEPTVPDEVLSIFQDEIKLREARRKRKEHQENIRFRKIHELNEKLMGFKIEEKEANLNLESFEQFPDAILADSEVQKKLPDVASFAKVLCSPNKKLWPSLPKSIDDSANNDTKLDLVDCEPQKSNDNDIGYAIFEAIEKSGTTSNNAPSKKKRTKKGTVLLATGLTFGQGK